MNNFSNKVEINEDEITIYTNDFMAKLRKKIFIPFIIFCIFLCYMVIKYDNIGIFRYIIIPFCILTIFTLRWNINANGAIDEKYILKVNKDKISYYCEFNLIEIPIKNIVSVEDKSFYYDFHGNGPSNKGWHHTFKLKITNGKEFIEDLNNKKALIIYKYLEDTNEVELNIDNFVIKHDDYLKLIEFIKYCINNKN